MNTKNSAGNKFNFEFDDILSNPVLEENSHRRPKSEVPFN